jgi:hypothetical protein
VLRLIGFRLGAARLRLRFVLAIVFGCRCSQVESVWNEVEGLC